MAAIEPELSSSSHSSSDSSSDRFNTQGLWHSMTIAVKRTRCDPLSCTSNGSSSLFHLPFDTATAAAAAAPAGGAAGGVGAPGMCFVHSIHKGRGEILTFFFTDAPDTDLVIVTSRAVELTQFAARCVRDPPGGGGGEKRVGHLGVRRCVCCYIMRYLYVNVIVWCMCVGMCRQG
jgi:hypothetical protein